MKRSTNFNRGRRLTMRGVLETMRFVGMTAEDHSRKEDEMRPPNMAKIRHDQRGFLCDGLCGWDQCPNRPEGFAPVAPSPAAEIAPPPYPQFCLHPDKCAGRSSCPRGWPGFPPGQSCSE